MGLEITSFHLSRGKEGRMHLPILQEDDFHKWWSLLFLKKIKWKAGRRAHQQASLITVRVEDGTAPETSEQVPVFIFYECKKNLEQKLGIHTIFPPQSYEPVSESHF